MTLFLVIFCSNEVSCGIWRDQSTEALLSQGEPSVARCDKTIHCDVVAVRETYQRRFHSDSSLPLFFVGPSCSTNVVLFFLAGPGIHSTSK